MRQTILFLTAVFASSVNSINTESFIPALWGDTVDGRAIYVMKMLERRDNCPAGYDSCSSEGDSGACCRTGTTCTQDAANNIACCPTGAMCTGVITGSSPASSASSSGSFQFPQPSSSSSSSSSPTTSSHAAAITGSTIAGAPFPFEYIPKSFGDAATCYSYYSQCQTQYSSCTASLEGTFGVTVAGSGGGVTVQGATAVATAPGAAQSICLSLSSEACYGLHTPYCDSLSTGGSGSAATTSGQFVVPSNSAQRRTSSLYDLTISFAVALAGIVV